MLEMLYLTAFDIIACTVIGERLYETLIGVFLWILEGWEKTLSPPCQTRESLGSRSTEYTS